MRFLADENCDFAVVRALRDAGHDILLVAGISPRAADPGSSSSPLASNESS